MYIYTFLLRMTDTVTSQNTDFPSGTFCILRVFESRAVRRIFLTEREKIVQKCTMMSFINNIMVI
jgi:hypothetical protein